MKKFLFLPILLFGFLSSPLAAQDGFKDVEKQVTEFNLKNGLKFLVLPRHEAPVVSFHTYVTIGSVNECRFRGATSNNPTTCTLTSTSFTGGSKAIVSYTWVIQYTYVTVKTITATSTFPSTAFADTCGQASSTDDGVAQPLSVSLSITDSAGNTASASSGSGSQPALTVRLFTCGL